MSVTRAVVIAGVLGVACGVGGTLLWRGRSPGVPVAPSSEAAPGVPGPRAGDAARVHAPVSEAVPAPGAAQRAQAVERGVAWLSRAQEPDGSFDLAKWNPWHGKSQLPGFSEEDHWFSPAATGLVALALLEAGRGGVPHAATLTRALERVLAWQLPDGRIGLSEEAVDRWFREQLHVAGLSSAEGPGYKARTLHGFNHAVPSAALALAASRPGGERWLAAARRALAHMQADEHPEYRWTAYLDPESDIGVAAYVALAARAASDAGADDVARPLLEALPDFLDRVTDPATGVTRMLADLPACFEGDDSTAINAYCRRLVGQDPQRVPLRLVLGAITRREPAWRAVAFPAEADVDLFRRHLGPVVNHDAFTYGLRALAGVGSERAKAHVEAIRRLLVSNQVAGGEHDGSWEPIGVWDRIGGRLYSTAMAVRALSDP